MAESLNGSGPHFFKVAFLGIAHLHVWSYLQSLRSVPTVELVGFYDSGDERAATFAEKTGLKRFDELDELLQISNISVVCAANTDHARLVVQAAKSSIGILCEKPIATTLEDADRMVDACRHYGAKLMTGFPCRFSPAFQRAKQRIQNGEVGKIVAISATNRGTCPFDWFVDIAQSGGGAMIDHVVHVADLLQDLLGEEPQRVTAQTGHQMYDETWEDCAQLMLEYPTGIFASLDSSWSRPQGYKTWGDVTLRIVGENGIIEIDLFGQEIDVFQSGKPHSVRGYGSNLDQAMIEEFLAALREDRKPMVSGEDGRKALRVALMGYESLNAEKIPLTLTD